MQAASAATATSAASPTRLCSTSKVDPETGEYWVYGGLVGAYTYSDMTGYALSNAGKPSG
ncbi:MAG: hypothetical protein R6X02_12285 [Enhygromyxa sp.]